MIYWVEWQRRTARQRKRVHVPGRLVLLHTPPVQHNLPPQLLDGHVCIAIDVEDHPLEQPALDALHVVELLLQPLRLYVFVLCVGAAGSI